jgi:hypothetical protein
LILISKIPLKALLKGRPSSQQQSILSFGLLREPVDSQWVQRASGLWTVGAVVESQAKGSSEKLLEIRNQSKQMESKRS